MESFGYRFDTPDRNIVISREDRTIVISGDTNPAEATISL